MTRTALRELLGVRNELLGEALVRLHANGRVDKNDGKLVAVVPA